MVEHDEQFEKVREWAATVAQQFENSFVCGDRIKEKAVPLFEPGELLIGGGPHQPCGDFFDTVELKGVSLNPSSTHKRITDKKSKQQSQRARFAERFTSGVFALKVLRREAFDTFESHKEAAASMVIETKFLIHLSHPNIIKLYGMTVEGMGSLSQLGKQGFFTILESIQETLEQRLERWKLEGANDNSNSNISNSNSNSLPSESMTRRLEVGEDLSSALVFLSNRKIIFGALRPENIGFDANYGRLKLMNFGNAHEECQVHFVRYSAAGSSQQHSNMRILPYTAPEVLRNEKVTRKSDVYSFGVLLWAILSLEHPFDGVEASAYMKDAVEDGDARPPMGEDWPIAACELIKKCWRANPRDRPNIMKVQESLEGVLIGDFVSEEPLTMPRSSSHSSPTSNDNEASAELDEIALICQRSLSASRGSSVYSGSFTSETDSNSVSPVRAKDSSMHNKRKITKLPFTSSMHLLESLVDMAAKEKDDDTAAAVQDIPAKSHHQQQHHHKPPLRRDTIARSMHDITSDRNVFKSPLSRSKSNDMEKTERMFNASDSCINKMHTLHLSAGGNGADAAGGGGGSVRSIGFQTRRSNFAPRVIDQHSPQTPATPVVPATPIRAAKALLNRMKSPIGTIQLTDDDEDDDDDDNFEKKGNSSIRGIGFPPLPKRVSHKRYETVAA